MKKLADYFYEAATLCPDKTAIWCDNEKITYKDLANLVSQYSNFLLENGVAYGDHIGIPMNNSIMSVALIFTAANLGIALVPINSTLPFNSIQTAFASANVKHIIARYSFFEQCEQFGGVNVEGIRICVDGEYDGTKLLTNATKMSKERPIIQEVTGEESFIITMTSGSTGSPKPISLTQYNKYLRAIAHIKLYGITKDDKILASTPIYHSLAERLVIIPLLLGGTCVLLPRFTPTLWLDCIKEQRVTFTIAVSAQLNQIANTLADGIELNINSLRCLVSSSSLLESHIKSELIDKLQCDFHEMYGTSEVSTVTSINFREAHNKQQSVGRPLQEADVIILRDNGEKSSIGEIGEIACKTTLICNGYYGMDEVFKTSQFEEYFKTGDVGFLDEDGYLFFSGRKKELIITGGINVYPQDIEKCLMELSEISECAAFSYPNDRLGEVVAVAIVLKNGKVLNNRTVQIHCSRNLADFQQPHKIFFLEQLPKNSMGKIVKSGIIDCIKYQGNQQ